MGAVQGWRTLTFLLLVAAAPVMEAAGEGESAAEGANPLRKVVTLLQQMSKETEVEGDKAKELFEKFDCYCKTNEAKVSKSIEDAQSAIGELESGIKELSGSNLQLEQELKDIAKDLAAATKAVSEATSQRKRDAKGFAEESVEMTNSIGALDKAIPALREGLEAPGAVLAQLGARVSRGAGRTAQQIQSFLQGGQSTAGSDQILGILEQMRDDFKANLVEATQEEDEAIKTFEQLTAAKKKEIAAGTTETNEKGGRLATQQQQEADYKEDFEDTSAALAADEKFIINLKQVCDKKTKEFEADQAARTEEMTGISQAIKILNSDEALELFKKTLPSPDADPASFIQTRMRSSSRAQARAAREALRMQALADNVHGSGVLSLLAVKMQTHHGEEPKQPKLDLAPLKNAAATMIQDLKNEQVDDDESLTQCKKELTTTESEKGKLDNQVMQTQSKMGVVKEEIATIKEELEELEKEVADLDAEVADATAQRKKEKSAHTSLMSELTMTSDLLDKAKGVLEKMYKPKEKEMLVQQSSRFEDSLSNFFSEDPPETASHSKQGAAGMGAVGLLSTLIQDVKGQQAAGTKEEDEAQADFDQSMADLKESRDSKMKDITGMEAAIARLEETQMDMQTQLTQFQDEHASVVTKEHALHASCDFLLENFEVRKKARAEEIESIDKAISILSGANFGDEEEGAPAGFLQVSAEANSSRNRRARPVRLSPL